MVRPVADRVIRGGDHRGAGAEEFVDAQAREGDDAASGEQGDTRPDAVDECRRGSEPAEEAVLRRGGPGRVDDLGIGTLLGCDVVRPDEPERWCRCHGWRPLGRSVTGTERAVRCVLAYHRALARARRPRIRVGRSADGGSAPDDRTLSRRVTDRAASTAGRAVPGRRTP